jgi:23S rRNA (cytosine1962-C5)-methyltransferase
MAQPDVKAQMLKNRLHKNVKALRRWASKEGISCYRVFDRDIPEIPLAIDWYEGRVRVSVYAPTGGFVEPTHDDVIESLVVAAADALEVPRTEVFLKQRERSLGGAGYESAHATPPFVVHEGGHRFLVNLRDHLDTGLFLDHRNLRLRVGAESRGKRVLNLFAYTGAFTVHAAMGGASSTTTVDLSPLYARWTEDNLRENGVSLARHEVLCGDVFAYLAEPPQSLFDIAVLDPPTVSKSKRATRDLDVQRDHPWLIAQTLAQLAPGGVLYFSTNFRGFTLGDVRARDVVEISRETVPHDFRNKAIHRAWRIAK